MEYQDACGTAARAAEFADFAHWSIFLFSWNLDTGTYVLNLAFTTAVVGTRVLNLVCVLNLDLSLVYCTYLDLSEY